MVLGVVSMSQVPEAREMALPLLHPERSIRHWEGGGLLVERPTVLPRGLEAHIDMLFGVGEGSHESHQKATGVLLHSPWCSLSRPSGRCGTGDYL